MFLNSNKSSTNLFKIYSLLGSLQFINLIFGFFRTKIISVFLGPSGLALFDTYNLTITLIFTIANFGLSTYVISLISPYFSNNEYDELSNKISILKKLFLYISFFSLIVEILLSPFLSFLFYKTFEKTFEFAIIGVPIFLTSLTSLNVSIIQSSKKLNLLVLYSLITGILIIITSYFIISFYKSVILLLSAISLINFLASSFVYKRLKIKIINIYSNVIIITGKKFIKASIYIAISGLLPLLTNYLIRIFLFNNTESRLIGFYSSANNFLNSYIMIIFSTMTIYYFPKLASYENDNNKINILVNNQIKTTLLLITPLIILIIFTIKPLIIIFYSNEFLTSINIIIYSLSGILFKTICWCVSYMFYLKDRTKFTLIIEATAMAVNLITCVIFFKLSGIDGLGWSYFFTNLVTMFLILFLAYKFYDFKFEKDTLKIFYNNQFLLFFILLIYYYVSNYNLKLFLFSLILFISIYTFRKKLINGLTSFIH